MHSVVLLYLKHLCWRYDLDQEMDFSGYYKKTKTNKNWVGLDCQWGADCTKTVTKFHTKWAQLEIAYLPNTRRSLCRMYVTGQTITEYCVCQVVLIALWLINNCGWRLPRCWIFAFREASQINKMCIFPNWNKLIMYWLKQGENTEL